MRMNYSHAHAEERLTLLLNEGYELLNQITADRDNKLNAGQWSMEEGMQVHRRIIDSWYTKLVNEIADIFPTPRERHEIEHPSFKGIKSILQEDFEWRKLRLNLLEKLEALRVVIDERLPKYTELPSSPRLYIEDIDSFQRARDVNPAMISGHLRDGYFDMAEDEVQMGIEQILDVSMHKKDWGGETNDLYTSNLILNGRRVSTAFLLKGHGLRKKTMEIADCGKNGDQILRLLDSPAQLFIIQFVGEVSEAIIRDIEQKVLAKRQAGQSASYCIINGQDTARLLFAYSKLHKAK